MFGKTAVKPDNNKNNQTITNNKNFLIEKNRCYRVNSFIRCIISVCTNGTTEERGGKLHTNCKV